MVVAENAGLECKTTSSTLNIKKLKGGDFPDEYYAQCVHYMAVTGADRWYLAILVLGFSKEFHWFCLNRDEEEITALNDTEQAFWEGNVVANIEPLPDGEKQTDKYISDTYTDVDTDAYTDLSAYTSRLDRYIELKEQQTAVKNELSAIAQEIKLTMKDSPLGEAIGYKVTWNSFLKSGEIDSKILKEKYPDAYKASVMPDTQQRRFLIQKVEV